MDFGIVNNCESVHCLYIMLMLWEVLCPFITDVNILCLAKCDFCPWISICCAWEDEESLWPSLLRWKQCSSSRLSELKQQLEFQWARADSRSILCILLRIHNIYLQFRLKWVLSSQLCSLEWNNTGAAQSICLSSVEQAQIDLCVPSLPSDCREMI